MKLFNDDSFLTPFEETVVCHASHRDGEVVVRSSPVRASVHVGDSIASDAGARIHAETGADMSIVIRRSCWPFGFEPRFGMRFEVRGRMCTAKSCDSDEIAYTVRLTADERAEGDQ